MADSLSSLLPSIVQVTADAAIACLDHVGRMDEKQADQAAVNSMRHSLNQLPISGKIVIGEGERDQAPMLYIGEEVGTGGIALDIALDPLEGTTLCAHAASNALSVIALGPKGTLLHAPDIYMDKIAVGCKVEGLDLGQGYIPNLEIIAQALGKLPHELSVMILNRPRHQDLIQQVKKFGSKICLITDGDIQAAINTALPETRVDVYIGSGGAPEGVLAAAALKCIGGTFIGKLKFEDELQIKRAIEMGLVHYHKQLEILDMVKGDVIFSATGVTDGSLVKGAQQYSNKVITETLVFDSKVHSMSRIVNHKFIL
ncbi:class II fructose-bisphosphatase [Rickettsiales endosymbiont of Stachyamoeba lipophora]|uniref:class II fructose-bisphosphatase n=1 Tax=Rickettsiales endosymbiont of Stachyamoeba lipophora TaxID=2486578 RepID=UPI000F649BD2|nr:class II fructose-bisphosphatase [Rickettsiales endosymbiont of Stachyamoeba lipophora]AZL15460.1 class II fructose-bisphosphatase [Rickettsiales endosymbiont of Stachyamoeba lipophora]